jgi:Trypsin
MRKKLVVLAAIVAVASAAGVARAIEWGTPDAANTYAGVGLVVFYNSHGLPLWRCTGSLVSPTVFLTAGHCAGTDGAVTPARAQVWFSNGYPTQIPRGPWAGGPCEGVAPGYPCTGDAGGVPHAMPGWNGALTLPNTHDLGVVVLDHAVTQPTYAVAPVGTLDALATKRGQKDTSFTVVGYGVQFELPVAEVAPRTRVFGEVQLVDLTSAQADGYNLYTSGSPGNGTGGSGTCYGDSGGPVFSGSQIVGVTSFGTKYCKGKAAAFRVDNAQAASFLAGFVH